MANLSKKKSNRHTCWYICVGKTIIIYLVVKYSNKNYVPHPATVAHASSRISAGASHAPFIHHVPLTRARAARLRRVRSRVRSRVERARAESGIWTPRASTRCASSSKKCTFSPVPNGFARVDKRGVRVPDSARARSTRERTRERTRRRRAARARA